MNVTLSRWTLLAVASLAFPTAPSPALAAELPEAVAVAAARPSMTLHAEGAQIYECKPDATGKLAWQFREPVATLIENGRTVGRHYAGPAWSLIDGSSATATVAGRAPGAGSQDIPLLKLSVTAAEGHGRLAGIGTIQRLATRGGVAEGPCEQAGLLRSVPYSADYVFFSRSE